jgi:hypothetical protein
MSADLGRMSRSTFHLLPKAPFAFYDAPLAQPSLPRAEAIAQEMAQAAHRVGFHICLVAVVAELYRLG